MAEPVSEVQILRTATAMVTQRRGTDGKKIIAQIMFFSHKES
jgi:hypothetical protein